MNCGLTHGSESEMFITNPEDVPFKNDEYHLVVYKSLTCFLSEGGEGEEKRR